MPDQKKSKDILGYLLPKTSASTMYTPHRLKVKAYFILIIIPLFLNSLIPSAQLLQ